MSHKYFFISLTGRLQQYDRSKSSTYKVDGNEWEITYGSAGNNAQMSGVVCKDTVCVS